VKLWRCEYTGEIIFGLTEYGNALFGFWLPFIGYKWIPCDEDGYADNDTWPPRYVTMKLGFMWFFGGWFYTPPWETEIRSVK